MTTATFLINPKFQAFDSNGDPASGYKLFTYAAGTATKQLAFTTPAANVEQSNPIELDSRGEANVCLDGSKLYKLVLAPPTDTDPPTNAVWTVDNVGLSADGSSFLQAGSGAVRRTMQDKGRDVVAVKDWAALGDTTDENTKVQNAIATMVSGSVMLFPATPNSTYYDITTAITPPSVNGLFLLGQGRRSSQIRAATVGQNIVDFGNTWATGKNGIQVRDLWLEGNQKAVYGLDMEGVNYSKVADNRISGCTSAGLRLVDGIVINVIDNEIVSNRDGVEGPVPVNSGPNGTQFTGNYISANTRYGVNLYGPFGWNFSSTVEGNGDGGVLITTAGGGLHFAGGYYELNNINGGAGKFDLYLGNASTTVGVWVGANHFNGYSSSNDACVRLKFANGHYYGYNHFHNGDRAFSFEAGGNISYCTIDQQGYNTTFTATNPTTVFSGLSNVPELLTNGNIIKDRTYAPCDGQNYITGVMPYSWTPTLGAGSTWTKSFSTLNGQPTGQLVRTGATTSISYVVNVAAGANSRVRGRFVSFGVDVVITDATSKDFTLSLADGTTTTSKTYAGMISSGQKRYYVTQFVALTATVITLTVSLGTDTTTAWLGSDALFVGMNPEATPQYPVPQIARGSFTMAAANTKTVNDQDVRSNTSFSSVITLSPTNAAAATLISGAKSLYISARTNATSFAVATADGNSAAGTETFDYVILN